MVIFVKSASRANELCKLLIECNVPAITMHKNMTQEERLSRYRAFKEGHKRILVATDLVGRGIDIERVNIVVNYDMPENEAGEGDKQHQAGFGFCLGFFFYAIGLGQNHQGGVWF